MRVPARSHTGHEYMQFVAEHPGREGDPLRLAAQRRLRFVPLADLLRQIGHDERVRKDDDSLRPMPEARFR